MKKYIAIIAVILIIVAGAFFAKSQFASSPTPEKPDETTTINLSDLFFVQYRVYAPESARVTLDGEALSYNENIDCFSTEVKKEGSYTLKITQEGCEPIEEKVFISSQEHEYTAAFRYTESFMSEGLDTAGKLLEELMQKCWSLSYDLSEYNFPDEETRISCEEKLADVVDALRENLSAEYVVGELKLNLSPIYDTPPATTPDNEGSSVMATFYADYTFDWQFKGYSYENSGTFSAKTRPYIIIEKCDGEWYIRDFEISLDNEIM